MTNATHRNDPRLDGKTAGRCRPCGRIWLWSRTSARSLRRARCPKCYGELSQTTARNVKKSTARLEERDPFFTQAFTIDGTKVEAVPVGPETWYLIPAGGRSQIGTITQYDARDFGFSTEKPGSMSRRATSLRAAAAAIVAYHPELAR